MWGDGYFVDTEGYIKFRCPNHPRANSNGYVYEHILIVEAAIGEYVNRPIVIHHVNGNRADNRLINLVLCLNNKQHKMLHQQQRALEVCGNPDWLRCPYCKEWDDPKRMYVHPGRDAGYHRSCKNKYQRGWCNAIRRGVLA